MSVPNISVVMCVYNRTKELRKSIKSILNQTFKDFELIIVDDGSTDDIRSVISESEDSRIRYLRLDKNYGVPVARNHGNRHAQGEYIAVMDSDDIMFPERLEVQFNTLEYHTDIDVVYSSAWVHCPDDNREPFIFHAHDWDLYRMLFEENLCFHSSVMHRQDCIITANYKEDCRYGSDYVFLAELAVKGRRFMKIDKPLIRYTRHNKSISRENQEDQTAMSREYLKELVSSLPEEQRNKIDYITNKKGVTDFNYEVSIIMPAYMNSEELELTLTRLAYRQKTDKDLFEVIVCDDGSPDNDVMGVVRKFSEHIHTQYFWNPDVGYTLCNVRNAGLKLANGKILVFLDADVAPEPDFISKVIQLHNANDNLLAIHARAQIDLDGEYIAGEDRNINNKDPIRMMAGGNISITRDNADMIGPFDVNYNLDWGLEDVDWAKRAQQLGIDIVYVPHITGFHIGHKTFKDPGKNRYYFNSKWKKVQ